MAGRNNPSGVPPSPEISPSIWKILYLFKQTQPTSPLWIPWRNKTIGR